MNPRRTTDTFRITEAILRIFCRKGLTIIINYAKLHKVAKYDNYNDYESQGGQVLTMQSGIRDTIKDNQANRASRNEELRSVIHGRFAEKRSLRAGGEANHSAGRKEWVKGGVASLMLLGGAGIFHGVAYASGNAEVTVEQETTGLLHQDEVPLEDQALSTQNQQDAEVVHPADAHVDVQTKEEEVTPLANDHADVQTKDDEAAHPAKAQGQEQAGEEEKPMISAARRAYVPEG